MTDYEAIESKFKLLRKRCQDIKVENRKVLEAIGKPKIYQITVNNDQSDQNDLNYTELEDTIENNQETLKLLNMTLRDFEKKYGINMYNTNKKESLVSIQGDTLAKFTYEKEMKAMSKLKHQHKDNINNIDAIAENLKQTSRKRYMIRKKQIYETNYNNNTYSGNSNRPNNMAYINIKNKQFNDKLQREKKQQMDQ
ncbi:Syf2p PWA37_004807 [Arxiozyma heterogenica]|uniref:Uncharacterized protein n=1 Tax=Arxiozyma heterogenica TaxID=278026 RepID=A0AAN7WJB5_9SACH|nr:hypothetical protein RI543_001211 [Kazachstania heterogenica]